MFEEHGLSRAGGALAAIRRHAEEVFVTVATMAPRRRASDTYRSRRTSAPAAIRLLNAAHLSLREASANRDASERYADAHLAALRAAAAVLADRTEPGTLKTRRPTSAWALLVQAAPEMSGWAARFADGAHKRALAETRLPGAITVHEADELVRDAQVFLAMVETTLGVFPEDTRQAG